MCEFLIINKESYRHHNLNFLSFLARKGYTRNTYLSNQNLNLVVEQTDTLLNEGDTQLLSSFENGGVILAAGGGGNVLDAGSGSAEDVVDEGELGLDGQCVC
jgi:hypothetical protein